MKELWYRIWSYVGHQFRSWNTGGEGIHSPYLFYLVRMLIYDENRFYCWRDIEARRRKILASKQMVEVTDYGTGNQTDNHRCIADIARTSLERPRVAQILFRLVSYLGHVQQRPLRIVELGTSLGITTAYLAMPDSRNHVETYEGSSALLDIAQEGWEELGIHNIDVIEGNIDDTLLLGARNTHARESIDVAYIDANHTKQATLRYFDHLAKSKRSSSIFVLDDIHHSREMAEAWRQICQREDVTTTMDLYHIGLVFFDKQYLKRHYKLRI